MPDPLAELVNAVADDPEVKAAARALALDTISRAHTLLRRGQPAMQLQIIRSLLPTALASLKESPEDASVGELRAEMAAVLSEVRGVAT